MLTLVIGNRNYSSWSFRAWLYLRESNIPFEEVQIAMFNGEWSEKVASYSPAGRVPVLIDGPITVWDSAAIMQYLKERFPKALGWPAESKARAHAMSIAAEMHSGFMALRGELPQNIRASQTLAFETLSSSCQQQVQRIIEIWTECRQRYHHLGPWLFGELSIADIMYIPVALRFQTYQIPIPDPASEFITAALSNASVQQWCAAAAREPEKIPFVDQLVAADDSPLTLG